MKALQQYLNPKQALSQPKLAQLQEQLSLPKIPQKPSFSIPKSSMQNRLKKHKTTRNIASETTFSPEQEQLHEEIKNAIGGRESPKFKMEKEKLLLPKITSNKKNEKSSRHNRSSRSGSEGKMGLSGILKDPYSFADSYFADINRKAK